MMRPEDILGQVHGFLKQSPVFTSCPLSLLLIGLEELIGKLVFICPCKDEQNVNLTVSLFTGPALLIFAFMYFILRPFKHGCSYCCAGANDDTQQNCPKAFASCLIPPVMWIFFLLLDGNYVACAKTHWEGVYVFDEELNRCWCKPIEGFQNEKELRHLVRSYVLRSQYIGYVMIGVFSALVIVSVTIYDCCISGKCDWYKLSCCRGPTTETQNEGQDPAIQELQESGSSATTRQQESGSSATAEQKQQGSGGSAKVEWTTKSSAIVDEGLGSGMFATARYGQQASGGSSAKVSAELLNLIPRSKQQMEAKAFKQ